MEELQPGKTVIGRIIGQNGTVVKEYELLYGNVVIDEDGRVFRPSGEVYEKKLNAFLESEEGKEFKVPSASEREEACLLFSSDRQEILMSRALKEQAEQKRIEAVESAKRQLEEAKAAVEQTLC